MTSKAVRFIRSARSMNELMIPPVSPENSAPIDQKDRFGGILEVPIISKLHRYTLDGFKVTGLAKILTGLQYSSLLDVGCGIGEYSSLTHGKMYAGFDNSFPRIKFAKGMYKGKAFLQADARQFPFKDNSFDAVLFANTAHHLSNEELTGAFRSILKVARHYVIVDDCVLSDGQGRISKFFYSLDRGTMFRHPKDFEEFFKQFPELKVKTKAFHRTFPGLYLHVVYVLEKRP